MSHQKEYHLNPHALELMQQYKDRLPVFKRMEELAYNTLQQALSQQGLYVTSIEHRIKQENSLAGKLELKGNKYDSLSDITDILGMRIITFYTDDVDKVAAIVQQIFNIDWDESVDKRKRHELTSFGYNSLHYICRLPKSLIDNASMPELNEYRFEIQMRTSEYRRQFSRLSGTLELIDDEFSRLRTTMTDYRRKVQALVNSGQLDEVTLDGDSFRSYLTLKPFERLNQHIAAVNQAEIYPAPLQVFLPVLEHFELNTLGDVQRFIDANKDDAYQYALTDLAVTDLDILSESIGLQSLCIVHALKNGNGRNDIKYLFDTINGESENNWSIADLIVEQAATLQFMNK